MFNAKHFPRQRHLSAALQAQAVHHHLRHHPAPPLHPVAVHLLLGSTTFHILHSVGNVIEKRKYCQSYNTGKGKRGG